VPKKLGEFSDNRIAWVALQKFEAIVFIGDDEEYLETSNTRRPDYDQVKLMFRVLTRRAPWILNLTHMTSNELEELKKCIDFAFDQAKPTCALLDARAQDAYDNGDDSWSRLYRPPALFVERISNATRQRSSVPTSAGDERVQPEHHQSIPSRPDILGTDASLD